MPLTYILSKNQICKQPLCAPFADITATHEPHETGKLHNPYSLYIEHVLQALA